MGNGASFDGPWAHLLALLNQQYYLIFLDRHQGSRQLVLESSEEGNDEEDLGLQMRQDEVGAVKGEDKHRLEGRDKRTYVGEHGCSGETQRVD